MSLRQKADLLLKKLTHSANTVSSSSILVERNSGSYSTGWKWWLTTVAGGGIIFLAIFLDRFLLINTYNAPPGADPGNWLTFAWELGGKSIRLAEWVYPLLVPIILRGLLFFVEPLTALKYLGLSSWTVLGFAFFVMLRLTCKNLPAFIQIGISVLFALAGYHGEVYAWGGYPQLLGGAFLLVSITAFSIWLASGKLTWFITSAAFSAGVIYTHHLMAGMLPVFLIIIASWQMLFNMNQKTFIIIRNRSLLYIAVLGMLSVLAIPVYWKLWTSLSGNPTNPNQFLPSDALLMYRYVFHDSPELWGILLIAALLAAVTNAKNPLSGVVAALLLGSMLLVLILWEVRVLLPLFIGIGFGTALVFERIWTSFPLGLSSQIRKGVATITLAVLLIVILPQSRDWFTNAIDYYRVMDDDVQSALVWINTNTQPGEIVAASPRQPFGIGWWIEGFALRPSIYATELKWLIIRQEREYAAIANTLFSETTTSEQFIEIILSQDIRWILVDNQHQPRPILSADHSGIISPVYSNSKLTIYKVSRSQ